MVNANSTIATVMKIGPIHPNTLAIAFCTYGAPETTEVIGTPVDKHINAVAVHKRSVSIYTDKVCTRPCFAGCDTFAEAEAFGADPTPASFENNPLFIQYTIHDPAIPPKIDVKSKASLNINENIPGICWILTRITIKAMAT